MAIYTVESTYELNQKQWSKKLFKEHQEEIYFKKFMGSSLQSPIITQMELQANEGDNLTIPKTYLLDPESGVEGEGVLEGNEQTLDQGYDKMTAYQMRNAVRLKHNLYKYANAVKCYDQGKEVLGIWKAQETDNRILKTLSANPTTNRVMEADAGAARKAIPSPAGIDGIATSDVLTVRGIQALKLHAITGNAGASEKMYPIKNYDKFGYQTYLFFVDPFSLNDLKNDPEYKDWATEESRARAKFFHGAGICMIDGVVIIECDKIQREENGSSVMVSKNLFLGAGALAFTYTGTTLMDGQTGPMQWNENHTFDYGNQVGIALGDCKGVKKIQFTRQSTGAAQDDNGVIVFYAASVA